MLEADFDTQEEMDAYVPPSWAGGEVSHVDEFSGGVLSTLGSDELEELLRVASPPTA